MSDTNANTRTDPTAAVPDSSQFAASSCMRCWIIAAQIAARKIMPIFSRKGVLTMNVVACELNRKHPEIAFIAKPVQASLRRPSIDA
jgi:hypothetical protein